MEFTEITLVCIAAMITLVTSKECALFIASPQYAKANEVSTYIELGSTDVREEFDVVFWLMPSQRTNLPARASDGALFTVTTMDEFTFKTLGHASWYSYMGLESMFQEISIFLKPMNQNRLYSVELYRAYPEPYDMLDGRWHKIRARRSIGYWHLTYDDHIHVQEFINKRMDVNIIGANAFLGGRPGYIDKQFQGVIKEVTVNGQHISLGDKSKSGNVQVVECDSLEASEFMDEIRGYADYY